MNTNIEYDFKAITPYDYELELKFTIENKFFLSLLKKSAKTIASYKGEKKDFSQIEILEELEIDKKYYPLIKTISSKSFSTVERELKQDKIEVISYDVKRARLIRNKEDWNLYLNMGGVYADKR